MSEITLTFPDGAERRFPAGITGKELAEAISRASRREPWPWPSTAGSPISPTPSPGDALVKILTRTDPEALELIRHDAAHVMAEAVQELWPGTQVTIDPVIENGFYYDFAKAEPFHPDDLPRIEEDARDHPPQRAVHEEGVEPRARQGGVRRDGRDLPGRARRRHPAGRRRRDLQTGRVVRPLPRAAHDLDRPGRLCLQIAEDRRRLLAQANSTKLAAAAPLRHRPGRPKPSSPPAWKQLEEAEKRDHLARPRDGPLPLPGGAGLRLLAPEGLDAVPDADLLHAPAPASWQVMSRSTPRTSWRSTSRSSPATGRTIAR